jgi:hypothetical protein
LALAIALGLAVGLFASMHGCGRVIGTVALFGLGAVHLSEAQRRDAANRIREALRRADIGIRKAALHMELDPSDLERALKGERTLDLWRLEMLPDQFWREYWPLVARDKGAPEIFSTWLQVLPHLFALKEEKTA